MDYELIGKTNHLEKLRSKNSKKCWNQGKNASYEQKTNSEKANFCPNTIWKFDSAKPLAFTLNFLFRRDQNHHSNLS